MTREETLKHFKTWCQQTLGNNCSDEDLHMANNIIALLEQEQEPCDDCISRKAVLDAIDAHKYSDSFCEEHNIDWSINLGMVHILVNELPSVTPQQKIGRWISNAEDDLKISEYTCSNCKGLSDEDSDFCPKCGAKMVEQQESEDEE